MNKLPVSANIRRQLILRVYLVWMVCMAYNVCGVYMVSMVYIVCVIYRVSACHCYGYGIRTVMDTV